METVTQYKTINELDRQEQLILSALRHLSSLCDGATTQDGQGFNGTDSEFGHQLARQQTLSTRQAYSAWKMLRKYWRQLKKANIVLPQKYQCQYHFTAIDEGAIVANLSKGTTYELRLIGDEEFDCTCEAYQHGNECSHVKYVKDRVHLVPTVAPTPRHVPPTPQTVVAHAEVQLLPGIIATPGQAIALEQLMDFAHGDKAIHGLFGFAGTGKSLLLQAWVSKLRQSGYDKPIVFTAPTNKAVDVLARMTDRWGLDVECKTCAKLLGLKPKTDPKNGEQYFEREYNGESTIGDYSIVVIDESSMVDSRKTRDGIWEHLIQSAGLMTKLLFVGDYAQLPPVKETISKVFLEVVEPSTLTEVRRYRGAIADIATDLRENLGRRVEPYFTTNLNEDGTEGLYSLNKDSWESNCIRAFSSDKYRLDANYVRALAWTNKRVGEINSLIRNAIRGEGSPRFVEGERLMMSEHFSRERGAYGASGYRYETIATSQEMEVLEAYEGSLDGFECWYLKVQLFDRDGTKMVIPVLHERSIKAFEEDQRELAGAKSWKLFYEKRQQFAWLDYAYAQTVHKSQGSTFQNVFVDLPDMLKNNTKNTFQWPDGKRELIWERNQLLYVALTRASHRVFVYE